VQTFNEVSFVSLDTGAHTPMAVGFNPRGVRWGEGMALVVSDASLAVIDLTVETLSPVLVDLSEDPTSAPVAEEVELSPDASFAFVRQFGADDIAIVDLVGLHDRELLRQGLSAAAVLARAPDLIWLPHPDHTAMIRDLLDRDDFWRDFTFYPDAFTYGLALRRPSPRFAALDALVAERFAVLYPGVARERCVARRR
jgi:hypothetical protein